MLLVPSDPGTATRSPDVNMEFLQTQFYQFAAILALAAVAGAVGLFLRQPLIVMFIAVGIGVGPAGLGITRSGDGIDLFARMGIAVLSFLVGMRLRPHHPQSGPWFAASCRVRWHDGASHGFAK